MNQDAIWDHFQNEGVTAFSQVLLKQWFGAESAHEFNEFDPVLGTAASLAFAPKFMSWFAFRNTDARSQHGYRVSEAQ